MIATIVEVGTLAKVVAYSLLAGVGIAVVFGGAVTSAASLLDAMRSQRTGAGVLWGAVTLACLAVAVAVVVLGIVVMTAKG